MIPPPLKGIERHIDLLLGTPLSTGLAYSCHPNGSKELQRQVYELVDHGNIRESLGPCPSPTLSVPNKDET